MAAPLSKPIVMHEDTRPSLSERRSVLDDFFGVGEQVERVAYRDLAVGDGYQARFVQLLEQVADCGLR